jgi:hypothetical protein
MKRERKQDREKNLTIHRFDPLLVIFFEGLIGDGGFV